MNKPLLLLLGLPVALVVGLLTSSSGASAQPQWTDEVTRDCRDVGRLGDPLPVSANYQRMVQSIQYQEQVPGSGLYSKPEVTLSPRGVVEVSVPLYAPSCPDVTYTLNVYDAIGPDAAGNYEPGSRLLGTARVLGTGARELVISAVTSNDTNLEAFIQVVTSDRRGTYDFAPDTVGGDTISARADGTPPGAGGQAFGG